ncbi:DeoR family transcriptional regulator [Patescibacteria group bacterium]|nr:DeoR family transcriptional regulator [Patescibacteria group bacterium]
MNNQLAYICDRIQKITEAVYRVTELLSDKEPIKWATREKSFLIFSILVSLKSSHDLEKNKRFEEIEELIEQVIAFLSLFSESRAISGINFEILKDEYESIKKIISEQKKQENVLNFPTNLFLAAEKEKAAEIEKEKRPESPIGQPNGQDTIRHNVGQNVGQGSRKTRIFDIIKEKKEVSIGELSGIFKECSEKTIQRDLLEMVGKGIIKKEGDKRWRKYSLIY